MLQKTPQTILWTTELDDRVTDMRSRGYTWDRIGELIGTTGEACRRRVGRLPNLKRKLAWGNERKQRFIDLYTQTNPQLSLEKIGARLNVSKNTIARLRDELGLEPRERRVGIPGKPNLTTLHRRKRCDGKSFAPKFNNTGTQEIEASIEDACSIGFDNGGLTFAEITNQTCRFIRGSKHDPRYCEQQAVPGKSWCEHHYRVVFRDV